MDLNVPVDKQSPVYHQNLVKSARSTLLIAVAFTVLNIVLLLIGSNRYFLYSATIPYYLTFFGYMFDNFMVGTYTLTGLTMAVVPVAVLALSWYLSKQNHRWLMAATVVFVLDTAAMVAMLVWTGDIGSSVLDIVFHGWVLLCLIRGVRSAAWLKNMPAPADEPMPEAENDPLEAQTDLSEEDPAPVQPNY